MTVAGAASRGDGGDEAPSAAASRARGFGRHAAAIRALVVFVMLAGATLWMWRQTQLEGMRLAQERFDAKVGEARFAIEQRMRAYEQVLRGGVGLFEASDDVRRDEWRAYTRTLSIDRNYPGIRGIGFAKRIRPVELQAHVAAVRAEGFPAYSVWPEGGRGEYTAIVYLEPFDWRNQRAFGYDMFSEDVRRAAMARARDSGRPAVSGKVTLVQETEEGVQTGFLMYLPVYRDGAGEKGVEERRAGLLGYVYAPFRMTDLMERVLGPQRLPYIRLQIHDGAEAAAASLMYDSAADESLPPTAAFVREEAFEFNGHRWTLRYSSMPSFDAALDAQKPHLILVSGLLVSALFAAVLWSLATNRQRARRLAEANRGLEAEIVERVRLEERLKKARDAADVANRAKSDFLANVSHELRTPLTLILAPLDRLLAGAPGREWRTQIARIQRNALSLLNQVNDVLDFSKIEAGKEEVRREAVDLRAVIGGLVEDAAAAAHNKACTLDWQVDPGLGTVCLDRRHVEKILLNLLSNAIKFTPVGGRIRIEATALDAARCELAVSDSGEGIPADKRDLLFQRFQQVDASATRRHGGTGLGLALVKELAERMGGEVGVESEPGHGARFFVRLPTGADRLPDLPAAASASEPALVGEAALRRNRLAGGGFQRAAPDADSPALLPPSATAPRILVADDNADMRDYLVELLGGDCRVLTAADGEQAWALLQREPVDLVVADVMMPGLDGLALAARVKASPTLAHVPVILLTARGGSEASLGGLAAGADDYIVKPFSPRELHGRVRAALRMGALQAELREKSHQAGMAMVSTGVVHDLGNILNGVTVASGILLDVLNRSDVSRLRAAAELLRAHAADLPRFLADDERGRALPEFLVCLGERLEAEHGRLLAEVRALRSCVDHAVAVIDAQQNFARTGVALTEPIAVDALANAALELALSAFSMKDILIERDYASDAPVRVDRHKALQVLLNLLNNAAQAICEAGVVPGRVVVRSRRLGERIAIEIGDNGIGVDPRHLAQLFDQGFTTKCSGHGVGLHASANWTRELGGRLSCRSNGRGQGATFVLELPLAARDGAQPDTSPAAVGGRASMGTPSGALS